MRITIEHTIDAAEWNKLVCSSPYGNIFQSALWGSYCAERSNEIPSYAKIWDAEGTLLAILLYFQSVRFLTRLRSFLPFPLAMNRVASFLPKWFSTISWRNGPIIFKEDKREEILDFLMGHFSSSQVIASVLFLSRQHGEKWGTFRIDLRKPEEELFQQIEKSARKLIKRTEKQGVIVRRGHTPSDLAAYRHLVQVYKSKFGAELHTHCPNEIMIKHLGEHVQIFFAELHGKPIAALGVLAYNGIVYESNFGYGNHVSGKRVYAGDLLKWKIMQWAKNEGFHTYDLSGVSPSPTNEKESGIYRFKKKFGGTFVPYSIIEKRTRSQR